MNKEKELAYVLMGGVPVKIKESGLVFVVCPFCGSKMRSKVPLFPQHWEDHVKCIKCFENFRVIRPDEERMAELGRISDEA